MKKKIEKIVNEIESNTGVIRPWRQILADLDPIFMEIQHQTYTYVFEKKKNLPRKFKEIIVICLDSATGFEPGFRMHLRKAFSLGATVEEILEALEVASFFNQHNLTELLPVLMEEIERFQKKANKKKVKSDVLLE